MNSETERKPLLKPIDEISLEMKNISRDISSIRTELQYIKILLRSDNLKKEEKEKVSAGWFFG